MPYKTGETTALITGITGQDGSYLAELLLARGYKVFGVHRRASTPNFDNVSHIKNDINWVMGDVTDAHSMKRCVEYAKPDEVYHLAAQSYVGTSWDQPLATAQITGLGTLNLLEAVKQVQPDAKVYQASSSEQFGKAKPPQDEHTRFYPRSPYGVAKCFAHQISVNYRESYKMHVSCGILFNHESPRRGLEFVTRKVTHTVAKIRLGLADSLHLGNLDSVRDWGHAKDYVHAMWLMLRQPIPGDFVISTGVVHTVRDLVQIAFDSVDLDWRDYVKSDTKYFRPAEVTYLCGNSTRAKNLLGWEPKITFEEMIEDMVHQDMRRLECNDLQRA